MNKEINFEECNIAVIRIRGPTKVHRDIENTLKRLNLPKKNSCTLVKNSPEMIGMLKKVKDYVTYGTIDDDTRKQLFEKRAPKDKDGKLTGKTFSLHPPIGGFERKGIKKPFSIGGVLGNRKENINQLIKKML